jgi:sugar phosphate isomerase/epimerase
MQLGISTYTYTWAIGVPGSMPEQPLSALGLLDKAKALGVHLVQVADNLPLDQLSQAELDAFAQRATDDGINVEVGTRGIHPDHLRTYLGLAQRLGSPILRVVVDTADHHPGDDEIIATIRNFVPELHRAGICLAVENHDRFQAHALACILQRIDSPNVGICLDTVNSFGALEGPEVVVETLGPWVVNLHVKDFDIRRASHQMGFAIEGRPAGQGRLDVPWLLEALRERTFNAILELWTPPDATVDATLAKENAWAIASVDYLRRFVLD